MGEGLREHVDPSTLAQLVEMGFTEALCRKALNNAMAITGMANLPSNVDPSTTTHLEQAIQWIDAHGEDWQTFETPKKSNKKKLTVEEIKARIVKRRRERE